MKSPNPILRSGGFTQVGWRTLLGALTFPAILLHLTVAAQTAFDFGDAPDGPYPTYLNRDGARHAMVSSIRLGALIDAEADGQPNGTATGDDINPSASDDEDGVTFLTSLIPGFNATVRVVASTNIGFLSAWLDFNADGDWADTGEQIFKNVSLAIGANTLGFAVPSNARVTNTFARFRYSTYTNLSFIGATGNGEVRRLPGNHQDQHFAHHFGDRRPDDP